MLDHAGEALTLLVGFWRFVFSRTYRQRKFEEWHRTRDSFGGRLAVGAEIAAGVVFGVGLPAAIVLVLAAALGVL